MGTKSLTIITAIVILNGLFITVSPSLACHLYPVANLKISPGYVAVGKSVTLDGSGSFDQDGPTGIGGGLINGIKKFEWNFDGDDVYDYYETSSFCPDGAFDGITTYIYTTTGEYTVTLKVTDNDKAEGGTVDRYDIITYPDVCKVNVSEDSDNDDMPDGWETIYGLVVGTDDAEAHKDGDGYNNLCEYLHGTNPADPGSKPDGPSYSLTIRVPDDVSSIQRAINASIDGDTIIVAEGTYIGPGNRDIRFYGKAIELRSTDPDDPDVVAATIIDCQGGGRSTYRGFGFSGEGPDSIVRGFTIKNGYNQGGAIYCSNASPTIESCVMAENRADYGGGICISGGQPTIKDCLFSRNTATAGGGIYIVSGSPVVANCVFHDNEASSGGGMTISGSPTLTNCVFIANEAEYGGAVRINSGASPKITNCTFNSNYATLEGGALYNQSISQSFYVINCILWGDYAPNGPEIANAGTYSPVVSYCNIQGGGYTGTNINAYPQFVVDDDPIGPDGIFGTWDDGLVLGCTSPCRDAGTNTPNGEELPDEDITHRPRVVDGDHDNSGENETYETVDMGAYELPRIWFVDKDAQGSSKTGYSWAHAYTDLQDALDPDKAYPDDLQSGDEIWVAAVEDQANRNFYTPDISEPYDDRTASFQLYSGVAVYGGFDGAEIGLRLRSWTMNVTVLSGDIDKNGVLDASNSYHVVAGAGNAVLDGFTITGGFANSAASGYCGGGIYCSSVSPLIRNCTIKGNYAAYYGGGMYNASSGPTLVSCVFSENTAYTSGRGSSCGGGIYNTSSSPTLANCTFSNNTAKSYGGGIYNTSSSPTLANCTFSKNTVNSYGGAMYNSSSSPILLSCIFRGNTSQNGGGGMCNYDISSPELTNCLFSGNQANQHGGGMYNYSNCSPTLINCTFSGNAAGAQSYGGGMYNNSNNTTVTNSIFWGNTASDNSVQWWQIYGATPTVTYSCIQDGSPGASPYPFGDGTYNIDTDPDFGRNPYNGGNGWGDENDDYGDLRLKRASPCRDTGNSTAVPADLLTDLGGYPRIVSTAVDMGAYEYQDVPPTANDDWAQTNVGEAISIYVLANDYEPDPDPLSVSDVTDSDYGSVQNLGGHVTYEPGDGFVGRDSFTYRVFDGEYYSTYATVTVDVRPPVSVYAGLNRKIKLLGPLPLKGEIRDDTQGIVTETIWSFDATPGCVATFYPSEVSQLEPTVTFNKAAIYELTLKAYTGEAQALEFVASDSIIVEVVPDGPSGQYKPNVHAGIYDAVPLPTGEQVSLDLSQAYVTDDGQPYNVLWQEWTIVDGPYEGAVFDDTGSTSSPLEKPKVVFTKPGTYTLQLSAHEDFDGVIDGWDVTEIKVAGNAAPQVNAGDNTEIQLPANSIVLGGELIWDDEPTTVSPMWKVGRVPNGGEVTFSPDPPTVWGPTAEFTAAGDYVLELQAFDGELWAEPDTVRITVHRPVVVDAGENQQTTNHTVTLNGQIANDPLSRVTTTVWSVVSLPTGSSVTWNPDPPVNVVNPQVTMSNDGDYVFLLEAKNGSQVIGSDQVLIIVLNDNPSPQEEFIYNSYVFSADDLTFFSYEDGVKIDYEPCDVDGQPTRYHANGGNPLDKGRSWMTDNLNNIFDSGGTGVCKVYSNSKNFTVLTGDAETQGVSGYFAMNPEGLGTGVEFYTYVPAHSNEYEKFVVFAYEDDTTVTIEASTDRSGNYTRVGDCVLGPGSHWETSDLSGMYVHVCTQENKPVSVLTSYDCGYFTPSAGGLWSGTEFHTFIASTDSDTLHPGNVSPVVRDLWITAYADYTPIVVRNYSGHQLWSGTLHAGRSHIRTGEQINESQVDDYAYISVTSDDGKPFVVDVAPYPFVPGYAYGEFIPDRSGTGIGTEFYGRCITGTTSAPSYFNILAYTDETLVRLYNADDGTFKADYTLSEGQIINANAVNDAGGVENNFLGEGLWRVVSDKPVSVYAGCRNAMAEFVPLAFNSKKKAFQLSCLPSAGTCVCPADPDKDQIIYTINYENTTAETVHGVRIVAHLPEQVDFVSADIGEDPADGYYDPTSHTYAFNVGTLNYGSEGAFAIMVKVNSKAVPFEEITGRIEMESFKYYNGIFTDEGEENKVSVCDWAQWPGPSIIYVDDDATGSNNGTCWQDAFTDLQDALDKVMDFDLDEEVVIKVAQGTYVPRTRTIHSNRSPTFHLLDLCTIEGGYAGVGAEDPDERDTESYETILSGDLYRDDATVTDPAVLLDEQTRAENCYHVVMAHSETDSTAVLDGFTVKGGNANHIDAYAQIYEIYGAGMYNMDGSPTIHNCTFTLNSALSNGGAVYSYGSDDCKFSNCVFRENFADSDGGGVYCYSDSFFGDSLTLVNCQFLSNIADNGGGMYTWKCNTSLVRCTFTENLAGWFGGGLYNRPPEFSICDCEQTLTNCTFTRNSAGGDGGGICNDHTYDNKYTAKLRLDNCKFYGNTANGKGGGMYDDMLYADNSVLALINCVFCANRAGDGENGGGGIYSLCGYYERTCTLSLLNCTFASNLASEGTALTVDSSGQGYGASVEITNSILWDGGSEIYRRWQDDNTIITVEYADIQDVVWPGNGNLSTDPLFILNPDLGVLEDNQDDDYGDLRLSSNSPCLDAGNSNAVTNLDIETDVAGAPRRVDDPVEDTGTGHIPIVDMGAYERQLVTVIAGSYHPSTLTLLPTNQVAVHLSQASIEPPLGPGRLTQQWSKVEGPDGCYFSNPDDLQPIVTFTEPGTYELKLTAFVDTHMAGSDKVSFTVVLDVDAGTYDDVYMSLGKAELPLEGVVTGGDYTKTEWLNVGACGGVSFDDSSSLGAKATFTEVGKYILRLEVRNTSGLVGIDETTIMVHSYDQGPVVEAGSGPSEPLTLQPGGEESWVLDDAWYVNGTPEVKGIQWSVDGSPAGVGFDDSEMAGTTVRFTKTGVFVLRLTALDQGDAAITDDTVTIQVVDDGQPPMVFGGPGKRLVLTAAYVDVPLDKAWAKDRCGIWHIDNESPNPPSNVTLQWECVPADGMSFIGGGTILNPTARFTQHGEYELKLIVTEQVSGEPDRIASHIHAVTVYPDEYEAKVNAGPDQIKRLDPSGTTTAYLNDAEVELGPYGNSIEWTKETSSTYIKFIDGTVECDSISVLHPRVDVEAVGTYVLKLAVKDVGGQEVASDTLAIIIGPEGNRDVTPPEVVLLAIQDGEPIVNGQIDVIGRIDVTVGARDYEWGIGGSAGDRPGVELRLCEDGQPFENGILLEDKVGDPFYPREMEFECTLYTYSYPAGTYTLAARAMDMAENFSQIETLRFTTRDSIGAVEQPVAEIFGLEPPYDPYSYQVADRAVIPNVRTGVYDFHGAAYHRDESITVGYKIELFKHNIADYEVSTWKNATDDYFVKNLTPDVENDGFCPGPLIETQTLQLDLTDVENGKYEILLTVNNAGTDVYAYAHAAFVLESPLKLGNLRFSQEDLVIPVGGIPLRVIRTYDSLHRQEDGDFGHGWSYSIVNLDIQLHESRATLIPVDPYDDNASVRLSSNYDRNVTLTLPDGRRTTFLFYLMQVSDGSGNPCAPRNYKAMYDRMPGIDATLETWEPDLGYGEDAIGQERMDAGGFWGGVWGHPGAVASPEAYDFSGYVLTTADGTKYFIRRKKLAAGTGSFADWQFYHLASNSHSGYTSGEVLARPCGQPYLDRIVTPSGEEIHFDVSFIAEDLFKFRSIEHWERKAEEPTKEIRFDYDGRHIVRVWAPSEDSGSMPTIEYKYDGDDNLVEVRKLVNRLVNGPGEQYETTRYAYQANRESGYLELHPSDHYLTEIIDPRGLKPVTYKYDEDGRLRTVVDAKSNKTQLTLDIGLNKQQVSDRTGLTAIYEYNDRGNVEKVYQRIGEEDKLITEYVYGNLPSNGPGDLDYDPGNPDKPTQVKVPLVEDPTEDADFAITRYQYDDLGRPLITTDPTYNVTTNVYDVLGNVTETIQWRPIVSNPGEFPIDYQANPPTTSYAKVSTTTNEYYYDIGTGWALTGTDQQLTNLIASAETIDPVTSDVLDGTEYGYNYNDGHLEKVRKVDAIGELPPSETTYGYDEDQSSSPDQAYSITDAAGFTRYFYYDKNGNQIRSWYRWDDPGNGVGVDHTVYTHTLYDDAGRVIQTSRQLDDAEYDADKATILSRTWYGKLGKPETTVDQFGVLSEYYYDELGNLVETATFEKSGDDGQYAPLTVSRTLYDADGRVLVTTDPHKLGQSANGSENVYDTLGRAVETRRWKDVVLDLVPFIVVDGQTVEPGDQGWSSNPAPVPAGMKVRKGVVVANAWDGSNPEPTNIGWTTDGGLPVVLDSLDSGHVAPLSYTRTLHDVAGRVKHSVALDENAYERPTTYEYDDAGKQATVIDPSGHYIDNPQNDCYAVGIVLYNGTAATCINFDAFDYSVYNEQTNPTGNLTGTHKTVTAYEGTRRDSVTDARGNTTEFTYDALGRLITTMHPMVELDGDGQVNDSTYTHVGYDGLGRRAWQSAQTRQIDKNHIDDLDSDARDERLRKRTFGYDSAGRLTVVILPEVDDPEGEGSANPRYDYFYDDNGNLAGILDPKERMTVFKYNELNQQTAKYMPFEFTDPTPGDDEITIADIYSALATASPDVENRTYDTLGRIKKVTDFAGRVTAYSYNERGLLQCKRHYRSKSQYSAEYPQANARPQIEYVYDSMGRRDTVRVKEFNAFGEQLSSELYAYDYDVEGRVRVIESPQGFVRYDYSDITGRKHTVRAFDPDADPADVYGAEEPAIDDADTQIGYTYDVLGRLDEVIVDKRNDYALIPGSEESARYTYSPVGSRQTLTYPNGNLAEYTYDALNRLTTLTNWKDSGKVENDRRSRFAYELAADGMRKQAIEFFTGEGTDTRTVTYNYDNLNRILEETALASDGTYSTQYTYDLVGNRTQRIVTVTNGTVGGTQTLTTTYTYDPDTDWLLSEVHSGPKWAAMFDGRPVYAYADGNGGVVYRDDQTRIGQFKAFLLGLPTKWSQHALAAVLLLVPASFCLPVLFVIVARLRMASARRERAGLSLFYRCVSVMLAYVMLVSPATLQQTAEATTRYSSLYSMHWAEGDRTIEYGYDANGSLTQKLTKETSSDTVLETVTYEYNLRNRLAKVITTPYVDGVAQTPTTTEYKYDPDGNRVQKVVDGATVTDYLIDTQNYTGYAQVFKETTGSDTTVYIIGDDILGQAKGADENAPKYLLYDGHGSTRQLVNNTGATVLEDYSYDAYGVMLGGNPAPGALSTNLLYVGEQFDAHLKQYYLRARYYDQNAGRFNRTDPFAGNLHDPPSLHKYQYCAANPVNGIDPSGEFSLMETLTVKTVIAVAIAAVAPALITAYEAAKAGASWWEVIRNASIAWGLSFGVGLGFAVAAPYLLAAVTSVLTLIPGVTAGAVKVALALAFAALSAYGLVELWTSDCPLELKISVSVILALSAVVALGEDGIKRLASGAKDYVRAFAKGSDIQEGSNPVYYGRRGGLSHRNRIAEVEGRLEARGWNRVAGGTGAEERVYLPDGRYRYPDLVMEKGGRTIAIQVGRVTSKGAPVSRELPALADLREVGEFAHVFFLSH